MANYCLECGGILTYDPLLKNFSCKSCGATYTYEELLERKERLDGNDEDRRRKQKDYLQWWLSKK